MTIQGNGNVGIGTTSPAGLLDLSSTAQTQPRLILSGQEFYTAGNTSTNGIALLAGVNRSGNRQLWFADSSLLTQNTSNSVIRITPNGPSITAIATDGITPFPLSLGSGSTINLYMATTGNVGIGTTAPSERLHATGKIRADNTGGAYSIYLDPLGIATAGPQLQFTNIGSTAGDYMIVGSYNNINNIDTKNRDFRIFNSAGNTLLYGSTTGNVGIGSTNPSGKIHVVLSDANGAGNVGFWDNTYSVFGQSGNTGGAVGLGYNSSSGGSLSCLSPNVAWRSMNYLANEHIFYRTSVECFRINTNGNVGIGTTAPSFTLDVTGTARVSTGLTTGTLMVNSSIGITTTTNNYSLTSGALGITGDTVISGNELYFTTAGVNPPTMNGRSSGTKIVLYPQTGVTQGDFSIGIEGGNTWFQVPSSLQGYKFYQGTTASMIMAPGGVLGIGTTQPSTGYTTTIPNAKLSILSGVAGSVGGTSRLSIGGDNSHYSAIEGAHTASGSTTLAFMTCTNASTNSANPLTRMFIDASGNVGIGTTAPSYTLDINGNLRALPNSYTSIMMVWSNISNFPAGNNPTSGSILLYGHDQGAFGGTYRPEYPW